jgi:AhpD family alkylhydroperoxidase
MAEQGGERRFPRIGSPAERKARKVPVAGQLLRSALRRSPSHIRHVTAVRPRSAGALATRVYEQVERDFGVIAPPVALHSPAPGPLAASWLMLRESLVADGLVPRPAKEAVAAAVSLSNSCPYCVEIHSAAMHGLAGPASASALSDDRVAELADPKARQLAQWARTSRQRDAAGAERPFTDQEAPEVIGVAATFHYLNRMVNIFLADSPLANVPVAARPNADRVLGWHMGNTAGNEHPAGRSLFLLPAAEPAADLGWAAGNPVILDAFGRATAAIEAAADEHVPEPVRELVLQLLRDWDGSEPALGGGWLVDALAPLPDAVRPVGRLAALTALASYRVDRTVIGLCRSRPHEPDDEALISITAWASLAAARQIASWHWPA